MGRRARTARVGERVGKADGDSRENRGAAGRACNGRRDDGSRKGREVV